MFFNDFLGNHTILFNIVNADGSCKQYLPALIPLLSSPFPFEMDAFKYPHLTHTEPYGMGPDFSSGYPGVTYSRNA